MLHDHNFPWLRVYREDVSVAEAGRMATLVLAFPCGLLRGALDIFQPADPVDEDSAVCTAVSADIVQMPHVAFQVRRPLNTTSTS